MSVKDLKEQRKNIWEQVKEIRQRAVTEQREETSDEVAQIEKAFADIDALGVKIEAEAQSELARSERSAKFEQYEAAFSKVDSRVTSPEGFDKRETSKQKAESEYRKAFSSYLRNGENALNATEQRALSAGLATEGGYMVPEEAMGPFIQAVNNVSWMRQISTVIPVGNAMSLGAVSLDNDPADPTWTSELLIGTEDSTMSFGKRHLEPRPLAKYIKMSRTLLAKAPSAESLVMERLAYKFAVTEENGFLNGSGGAGAPLGVFTASNDGVSTGRDVATGNTSSSITFDGLISCFYSLKPQYRARASWIFHRDAVKQIRTLKFSIGSDAVGYAWEPSVKAGEQDTILGRPVYESEYAPNTFTSALYVGIVGDFSNYWIADGTQMEMQRLVELYAATNQVGLIARRETDGMPVLAEAFARVKLG